jgi:hypothetical protein
MKAKHFPCYDLCIIGSGPAGLASLSAVREPYSLDHLDHSQVNRAVHSLSLHQRLKVCVVDVHDTWLHSWKKNFEILGIEFLRSPTLAHPNVFDQNALLAYAVNNDRTNELLESGCFDGTELLALGQTQSLWKLPSTQLFVDFCEDLADSLPHDYIQGKITCIAKPSAGEAFRVELAGQSIILAKAVILATGPTGRPIVPPSLQSVPRLLLWAQLDQVLPKSKRILVVGGGLTAVQVALEMVKLGKICILCSRRPLVEKHFDIGFEWFDSRTNNKCMFDFYHQDTAYRLAALKQARDGGSVPPIYMRQVEHVQESGRLIRLVGEVRYASDNPIDQSVVITIDDKEFCVDHVVLACGLEPNCLQNPEVKSVFDSWPIPMEGGLPSITEDLRWKQNLSLYVVGSLGSLTVNTGPDAGNLMGIRRAAQLVANALDCRCWLRETALVNPFEALLLSDDESFDSDNEVSSSNDKEDKERVSL